MVIISKKNHQSELGVIVNEAIYLFNSNLILSYLSVIKSKK